MPPRRGKAREEREFSQLVEEVKGMGEESEKLKAQVREQREKCEEWALKYNAMEVKCN